MSSTPADPFQLHACGLSDAGRVREGNEDAFFISEQQGLFLVSDGMGGAPAGALASAMTVQALPLQLSAELGAGAPCARQTHPDSVAAGLVRAIRLVNELLLDKTRDLPGVKGLGATVVAGLCAKDGFLTLAHVGDSRAYLLRQGILERLTFDHTVPEMLLQNGLINRRQLRRHPARHVITRHIGMEDCPPANAALLRLQPGDRILFCTDGLTGMLADREIGAILQETPGCKAACRRLIDGANEAGGTDNITAVIVDVEALQRGRGRRRQRLVVRRGIGRSLTPPQDAPMHAKGLVPPSADNAKGNAP